jgi:DNA-binding FadR family transcriptional regulator
VSPGPTFDRVYLALKERLTGGHLAPGDHLEPATLGSELNASITPVRDALHRLVGERIVEAPRNDGFRVPAPLEAELRDLYGWNGQLVDLAIRSRGFRSAETARPKAADDPPADAAELFLRISHLTGNPEHEAAIENLNDRLSALRVAEAEIFADLLEEFGEIQAALDAADLGKLRRLLATYHRRRQRCAPDILAAARKPRRPQ